MRILKYVSSLCMCYIVWLSPVHRSSGASGRGHAAQLHRACCDNLGHPGCHHPVCQTDMCGHAGGTVQKPVCLDQGIEKIQTHCSLHMQYKLG